MSREILNKIESFGTNEPFQEKLELIIKEISHPHGSTAYMILHREFFAWGPLSEYLEDGEISEILVNDWNSIWIEKKGQLSPSSTTFIQPETYALAFQRLCEQADVNLDIANPVASTEITGFRASIVVPPLVQKPTLSLRRNGCTQFNLNELGTKNYFTETQLSLLKSGLSERQNILFIGGTGSGKTTLLNALLKTIPRNERVLILEDTDEIERPNSSSLKLKTLSSDSWHLGDLVRTSLRLRPDRIVVGEVRGGEASDLLLALSSGHSGSFCTLHAGDPRTALSRLEALVQIGQPNWKPEVVRQLIHDSIHWVVSCERNESTGARQIKGVYAIRGLEPSGFLIEQLDEDFVFDSCVNI